MREEGTRVPRGPMGTRGAVEKPKAFKETWKKLIQYLGNYAAVMAVALVASALSAGLQILGPDRLKDMTNVIVKGLPSMVQGIPVVGNIDLHEVHRIGVLLVVIYLISALLGYLQSFIMATMTQRLSKRLRKDISGKIQRLPLGYFDRTAFGDILSRVTNDVDAIAQTMNQSLGNLASSMTLFLGAIFMMFYTNWIMSLVAVVASLLGFVVMTQIISRSQRYFVQQQKNLGDMNGHIEEIYSGHSVVKVFNGSRQAKALFRDINGRLYESAWKSQFLSGLMMPLMNFVGNLGYVAVSVVGAMLAMRGRISFGVIVAFMMYVRFFTQPLNQMAQAANNLQRTAAAAERVFEFLGEEEMEAEGGSELSLQHVRGDVEFRHVQFGYDADAPVLKDFSASVKSGQKIAIVGPTGAGKTTLVNLLMRFYEMDGGDILLDGVSIRRLPRATLREQFSMVLQDTWIFQGSVIENIRYNSMDVRREEVIEACKVVGLHHFVMTLPEGYDTILDEKASLSEGQKQLLTIARALVQQRPLLILDEATSSVDTRTEKMVQRAMERLSEGRTSFVIAHRLSTIKHADQILVMRDGDIVERGSHSQLLERGGFYAELYNSQFELA